MSDLNVPVRRQALMAWPITVLSGIALCIVTLSIAQALRSHGIIVLVVILIAVSGIGQTLLANTVGKAAQTFQIIVVCLLTSSLLWVTGFLPSTFLAGAFCLIQICALNSRNETGPAVTGTTMIFCLTAVTTAGLSLLADLSFEIVILVMCLASLVIALCNLSFRKQQPATALPESITCLTLMNTVDLWLAVIILTPPQAIMYFSARLLTFLLPAMLHSFEILIAPAIYQSYDEKGAKDFVHAMARVNLSLFLIASAIATLILAAHSNAIILLPKIASTTETAGYLILAIFLPAALGKTVVATNLLVPKRTQNISEAVSLVCAGALLAFQAQMQAYDIAFAFLVQRTLVAVAQSMHTIKNYGIWPGPTALFVKKIRILS
jgi:hypothetical protein